MKKSIITLAIFLGLAIPAAQAQDVQEAETTADNDGPNFSKLDVSPLDVVLFRGDNEEPLAKVLYSRPQTRGRDIFGKLVPYGEVWRTGANEATEITFYEDVEIGGKTIEAGTYSLYTIPKENEWTIILNKSTNIWGAYDYKVEKDVARITVPVRKSPIEIEALSMAFEPTEDGTELLIGWDDRYVSVPFQYTE